MSKKWRYTVSGNGRHQISEDGKGQVCSLWNCKDTKQNAKLIQMAPDMHEYLIELRGRLSKTRYSKEVERIDIILSRGE